MKNSTGAATVRIAMPSNMQESLIFHYNLKFYDSEGDSFEGVSLKRFVMQVSLGLCCERVSFNCVYSFGSLVYS